MMQTVTALQSVYRGTLCQIQWCINSDTCVVRQTNKHDSIVREEYAVQALQLVREVLREFILYCKHDSSNLKADFTHDHEYG